MTATTLHRNPAHGWQVLSATINDDGAVVVFDLPARHAGTPGTVGAGEAAGWSDADWRTLARSRVTALRNRQTRAGLRGPRSRMSATYAADVARQQEALRPKWVREQVSATEVDIRYGRSTVETWRSELVPGLGLVWARYPVAHAFPTGYQRCRP